jgi:ribosomal protein L25 (general stress protein Ctc)
MEFLYIRNISQIKSLKVAIRKLNAIYNKLYSKKHSKYLPVVKHKNLWAKLLRQESASSIKILGVAGHSHPCEAQLISASMLK